MTTNTNASPIAYGAEGSDEGSTRRRVIPAVDVVESKDQIMVIADMPGVDEQSVDVTLENDVLTISGAGASQQPAGQELVYGEYAVGDYQRAFTLSDVIQREGIRATVNRGVLRVMLPKKADVTPRAQTIPVKTA